ncbi:MAG: peptidylprolyl isomerase [Crocinitomicaceae bacterium]|nr:peptidylprolyl isomerase [Crocinitomicaceae bacterium]
MNKFIVLAITLVLGSSTFSQEDPVIMTIDDKEITKTEFLQIYLKNNNDPKYDKQSLDEYVELFTKFKLKVAEAENLGYGTIPKLVKELRGYTKQLALPYLVDSLKTEALVKEAYYRTANEVRASHILIKVNPKASPKDTIGAWNQIMQLKRKIEGGEDFATVAKTSSQDPSAANNSGDLGYFTAFQMVYQFEDKAYKTEVGKVSMPFRTRFGYHILKVDDKRAARGSIETAHIMVSARESDGPEVMDDTRNKINEIYDLLNNGGNFEELVKKFSDDPSSVDKQGKLPAFGTGSTTRMVPAFEDAAFALENDGDFSKPVKTAYGFHIVKRLKWSPVPKFDKLEDNLSSRVAKDERSKQTQNSFVSKLKVEYKYKSKAKKGLKWFYENLDSTYFQGKFSADQVTKNKPLFKLDKKKFTSKEFAEFLASSHRGIRQNGSMNVLVDNQYKIWEKNAILDYEESKLTGKYPAYKALVTEYHDGILLYEVMSDLVWNKAMKDTTGLKEFHAGHKGDYIWGTRLNSDIFECYTAEAAKTVFSLLTSEGADTLEVVQVVGLVNGESELNVRHRNSKFDTSKTRYLKEQNLGMGVNEVYEYDGKFYVIRVDEILEPSEKEFGEAKGAITSDYQNYLEQEWLKELRKKHTVNINKEALYSIGE